MLLALAEHRNLDAAGAGDRTEVVADQIDDHHVLGPILGSELGAGRCGAFNGS
jgi:hypothetical protein